MRRTSYMKRASKRFLEGTRCKTPVEAVEAGVRTLNDWANLLTEERENEVAYLETRMDRSGRNQFRGRLRSLSA